MYKFKTEQWLPLNIHAAWEFFSSPTNLSLITPPELDFKIITPLGDKLIYNGLLIDYSVKPLFGIPVKWKTEISGVCVPTYFKDSQLKGPYQIWEHEHYFVEKNNGVLMTDEVRYQLPFGFIGQLAHRFWVRSKIESIFEYRKNTLNKIFNK